MDHLDSYFPLLPLGYSKVHLLRTHVQSSFAKKLCSHTVASHGLHVCENILYPLLILATVYMKILKGNFERFSWVSLFM